MEARISVVVMADNPSVTAEKYETVIADIGHEKSLPPGCSVRIAGPGPDGGWRVITVWDDLETAQAFMTGTLRPAQERAGITPSGPPTTWELHQLVV